MHSGKHLGTQMDHSHYRQSLKPQGILKHRSHSRGREPETIAGLFLGMYQETRSLASRPESATTHLTHTQALDPGWRGPCPWAALDQPRGVYHSVPKTDKNSSPDKPDSVSPCIGLQDNQSESLRGLSERIGSETPLDYFHGPTIPGTHLLPSSVAARPARMSR